MKVKSGTKECNMAFKIRGLGNNSTPKQQKMLQNCMEKGRRFITQRPRGYAGLLHTVLQWIAIVSCENVNIYKNKPSVHWILAAISLCFSHTQFIWLNSPMLVTVSAWIWAKYSNSLCLSFPFPKEQLNTYQASRDALRSYIICVSTAFSDNTEDTAFLVLLKTELPCGNSALVISLWDLSKAKINAIESFLPR